MIAESPKTTPVQELNVLGTPLAACSTDPLTGFYRNGCCSTGPEDSGSHTVCSVMTDEFLQFSKSAGNDLITPMPEYRFPGLRAGDRWCLCAMRWLEAFNADCAPKVILESTHERALDVIGIDALRSNAVDG